jgi:hypothetical protein
MHSGSDVQVWNPATGRPLSPPVVHLLPVNTAFFTFDGTRLVTVSESIRVWDAATSSLAAFPIRFSVSISSSSLSPDGRHLLVTCREGTAAGNFAQVLDLSTGWPITPPLRREQVISDARFSPDGRRLATACASGDVLLWNLQPDSRPLEDLVRVAELLSGTRVEAEGASVPITTEQLREVYEALHNKAPETFAPSRAQVIGWHYQQFGLCEAAGLPREALVHLNRVIELGPRVDALVARREALLVKPKPEADERHLR